MLHNGAFTFIVNCDEEKTNRLQPFPRLSLRFAVFHFQDGKIFSFSFAMFFFFFRRANRKKTQDVEVFGNRKDKQNLGQTFGVK